MENAVVALPPPRTSGCPRPVFISHRGHAGQQGRNTIITSSQTHGLHLRVFSKRWFSVFPITCCLISMAMCHLSQTTLTGLQTNVLPLCEVGVDFGSILKPAPQSPADTQTPLSNGKGFQGQVPLYDSQSHGSSMSRPSPMSLPLCHCCLSPCSYTCTCEELDNDFQI